MKNVRNGQIRRGYRKEPHRKACALCVKRKLKCWGGYPCENCSRGVRPCSDCDDLKETQSAPEPLRTARRSRETSDILGRAWTCIRCQTLGTKRLGGYPCDGCRKEDAICDIRNANDSGPVLDEITVAVGLPSPALVSPTAPADDAKLPVKVVQHSTTSLEAERYLSLSAIQSDGGRQDQMSRAFDSSNVGTGSTLPGTNSGLMRDSYLPFDNGGFGSWTTGEGRYNYATLAGMYIQFVLPKSQVISHEKLQAMMAAHAAGKGISLELTSIYGIGKLLWHLRHQSNGAALWPIQSIPGLYEQETVKSNLDPNDHLSKARCYLLRSVYFLLLGGLTESMKDCAVAGLVLSRSFDWDVEERQRLVKSYAKLYMLLDCDSWSIPYFTSMDLTEIVPVHPRYGTTVGNREPHTTSYLAVAYQFWNSPSRIGKSFVSIASQVQEWTEAWEVQCKLWDHAALLREEEKAEPYLAAAVLWLPLLTIAAKHSLDGLQGLLAIAGKALLHTIEYLQGLRLEDRVWHIQQECRLLHGVVRLGYRLQRMGQQIMWPTEVLVRSAEEFLRSRPHSTDGQVKLEQLRILISTTSHPNPMEFRGAFSGVPW
ncbi:hypothetical protein Purlil1_13861 [Purpureocillium lilacinum]|uniref:Zn(2)-C6 fungal-type domain-containing protein n=1 Tax=Purpureocillium lilacinum TaxID=33203 RepID=A0ABR0BCX9_PURLI|nr:hypothetical protein Purlil1_13861 [Purpureocillium lilacinum]